MTLLLTAAVSLTATPTSSQIASLLRKNFAGIRDYRVDAVLTVKGESINVSGMKMTVFFKQPGKVHIEAQEGFAMLPRNVQMGNPAEDLSKNFDLKVVKTEKTAGRNTALVKMIPKNRPQMADAAMNAVIDMDRGLLMSMESGGSSASRMKSTWTYTKVDGRYWLPSQITAEMMVPKNAKPNSDPSDPDQPKRRFHRLNPGQGTMTVKFTNYRVNKGIPDSVFRDKRSKEIGARRQGKRILTGSRRPCD